MCVKKFQCLQCCKIFFEIEADELKEMEEVRGNSYFSSCDHVDADARLFCRTCKKLICDDCIISREHADHVLDKLQSAEEWIEKELESKICDVRDKVPSIESKLKECKDKRIVFEQRMSSMVDLVNTNYETSVHVLKGEKDNLLKELTNLKEINVGEYEGKEDKMTGALATCRDFESTAEQYLHEKEAGRIAKIKEIPKLPELHFEIPNIALPFLLSEQLPREIAKKSVGILKTASRGSRKSSVFETSMPQLSSSEEISIVARDRYLTTGITAICPVDSDRAWVTRADNLGCLDLVTFDGNRIRVEKTTEIDHNRIDDLAINNSGDLLIVVRNSPLIRVIRHGRKGATSFTDVSPYIPFGLCVTEADHVLISAAKASEDGSFKGTILDLNDAGKLTRHHDIKDKLGNKIQLQLPRKVRETTEKLIVILECVELTEPKIFITTEDGELVRVINGKENNFACVGICCDLLNKVVIADRKNNSLIFADEDPNGILDRHDVDRMYDPWCLATSIDGKIWIGCGNSYVMTISTRGSGGDGTYANVFA